MPQTLTMPRASADTRRQRLVRALTHLIFIGMLFVLPEIVSSMGRPFQLVPQLRWGVYAKSLVYIAVFYINYCFIIGGAPGRRGFAWRLIVYNLAVIAVAMAVFWLICQWMEPYWNEAWRIRKAAKGINVGNATRPRHHDWGFLEWLKMSVRDIVMVVLTIALSIALKLSDAWMALSRRQQEILADKHEEELRNLKSQLNPHFLFNTLNSIYALIEVSPPKAQEAVHELSGMLRYVLYDNSSKVSLDRETAFVSNYVRLMQLRLAPSTRVECTLECHDRGKWLIAPLLFVPLVENAFKYGNTGEPGAHIAISVTAGDSTVVCRTVNGCRPPAADIPADRQGGIGLANLRRRLQLIYGDRASLRTGRSDNEFEAVLTVPITNPHE